MFLLQETLFAHTYYFQSRASRKLKIKVYFSSFSFLAVFKLELISFDSERGRSAIFELDPFRNSAQNNIQLELDVRQTASFRSPFHRTVDI